MRVVIPAAALADEIEFAIAYIRACNPGRDLTGEDRKLLAGQIVAMITERAEQSLSGMRIVAGEEIAGHSPGTNALTRRNLSPSS